MILLNMQMVPFPKKTKKRLLTFTIVDAFKRAPAFILTLFEKWPNILEKKAQCYDCDECRTKTKFTLWDNDSQD